MEYFLAVNEWLYYYKNKDKICPGKSDFHKLFNLMKFNGMKVLSNDELERLFSLELQWLNLQAEVERKTSESYKNKDFIKDNDDLISMRITDLGAHGYFYQVQLYAGLDNKTIDELADNDDWKLFNYYNGLWIAISNDLFSIKKETFNEEYHRNFIFIKMMNNDIAAQQAFRILEIQMLDSIEQCYVYCEKLKSLQNKCINNYTDYLIRLHHGAVYWQSVAYRYKVFPLKVFKK